MNKLVPVEKLFQDLINRNSLENESNTPDWILGQFLASCLAAFNTAVQQRETWYGRDARPTSAPESAVQTETAAQHKCCGDFDSLTDAPECRNCPDRQHYLKSKLSAAPMPASDVGYRAMEQKCSDLQAQLDALKK
jgi:hypothetical protein